MSPRYLDRRAALDAAERSGIREGLPPVEPEARVIAEAWARGEVEIDEAVARIAQLYRGGGSLLNSSDQR